MNINQIKLDFLGFYFLYRLVIVKNKIAYVNTLRTQSDAYIQKSILGNCSEQLPSNANYSKVSKTNNYS